MTAVRRVAAGALAGVSLAITSACGNPVHLITGGNSIDDYCSALQADQGQFAAMIAADSPTALINHLGMLTALAGKAPDDVADDWQTFVTAIQGLQAALAKAGVSPSAYENGKPPANLSTTQRQTIQAAADQLSASVTVTSADDIEQEARDVCKINLGL